MLSIYKTLFLFALASLVKTHEDGFTFDMPEGPDFDQVPLPSTQIDRLEAVVGKLFHLVVQPKSHKHKGFVAKQHNSRSLPHWLVFNKNSGTFWGVPLPGDEATLHIIVLQTGEDKILQNLHLKVVPEDDATMTKTCKLNEDSTVLTLLLDRSLQAIKPRQRVIAVNNVAKYFRIPFSAFTLKPQYETDDITDSSVVLAGPGNVQTKTSKTPSRLEVLVGCDGRLWESTAALIHNLKLQARDGTISEVLRLPLIGWRVKTETEPILRSKRQAVENYGSGDYDDEDYYYDDYEDYKDDNLGAVDAIPSEADPATLPTNVITTSRSATTTTTTTTTTSPQTSTHPHRHHHGEVKPSEEYEPDDYSVIEEEEDELPLPDVESKSTVTQSSITMPPKPPLESPGPTKINIPKPQDALDFDPEYDYDDAYDDTDDDDDDQVESETVVPDLSKKVVASTETVPVAAVVTSTTIKDSDDDLIVEPETETTVAKTTFTLPATSGSSTTVSTSTTELPTTLEIVEDTEPPTYTVVLNPEVVNEITTPSVIATTTSNETNTSSTTTLPIQTVPTVEPEVVISSFTTSTTLSESQPTTSREEAITTKTSTTRQVPSTVTEEVLVAETVEPLNRFIPEVRNTKPYIEKRLQYKSVTAGKVFRFEIPKTTFKDPEDGYNLTFQVLDSNEQPLSKTSWLQFNPSRRELYGLPLPEDVSNWIYIIRASDKEGAYEQDKLTVQVQQHRLERVINHEFLLQLRIEKPQEYPHYVDWSLKVLRALGRIYNSNMSEITVRQVNQTGEPVLFAWSNDSLPTSYCPRSEIETLYKMLTANDRGDPSRELGSMLAPDLRIKKVVNKDLTICEQQVVPPVTPTTNFSPILRNPVDKVNATLGELLIYKVKDDTFYDPEDVDPASLNITLLTADLNGIPASNWLQFDSKNREFYGIPRKTGRTEYFLLCVDTGGMSAKDSLEVVVHPASKKQYNVEFSMSIEVPFEVFSNSASMQRKFVEKLMEIFEENAPDNFHFLPFKAKRESNFDSTVVYWFNKSLPVDSCPIEQIKQLEYILHSDTRSISSRVHRIMGPDFRVSTIKVHHIGNCKAKPQAVPTPDIPVPSEESPRPPAENDIMITLILPIIIIAIMLFIAFVAACILYRKRRMGKMNVEEDGRQSYGNKGIPVIFQEELEEKPEPGTKAPVILKDEKPPLAPPEYSKSGSLKLEDSEPYQPPPPFTRNQDNGRQPRPKPTPTYRKPPPYVPP